MDSECAGAVDAAVADVSCHSGFVDGLVTDAGDGFSFAECDVFGRGCVNCVCWHGVVLAVSDGPPVGFSWCSIAEVGGDFVGEFAYVGGFELGGDGASSVACGGDVVAVVEEGDSCV